MNIFEIPHEKLPQELCEIIAVAKNVRIERIVSTGQVSYDWYDQNETEWVLLLQGSAVIEYEDGREVKLCGGEYLLIPPHIRHKVSYTSANPACIWLCVFF